MGAIYIALAVVPRAIWGISLVDMLYFIFNCQGGFEFGQANAPERVLSVHYICMSIAWPILMTEALLTYRAPIFYTTNRRVIKTVHALLQTLASLFITIAIVFAVLYKANSHGAHFWSAHAWIGAGAIALYCLQYPLGLYAYVLSSWKPSRKAEFYALHRYLGLATFITGLVAGMTGLMETQEFDVPGVTLIGPGAYTSGRMLLAAKAFMSLLIGLAVTLAYAVLPQVGTVSPGAARPDGVPASQKVQLAKAQAPEV